MARLLIKSDRFHGQVIELKLGLNRIGRSPENDFQVEHATVSATHCEVLLGNDEIIVRDCGSTNGTFVSGKLIQEASLSAGQTFFLGEVEIFVETTEVTIAIPHVDVPLPAPPVVLSDGSIICPRHTQSRATYRCNHCREVLCDACVTHLRRRGGKVWKLCSLCSHPVERIGGEPRKKRTLLSLLQKTVKLPFHRHSTGRD